MDKEHFCFHKHHRMFTKKTKIIFFYSCIRSIRQRDLQLIISPTVLSAKICISYIIGWEQQNFILSSRSFFFSFCLPLLNRAQRNIPYHILLLLLLSTNPTHVHVRPPFPTKIPLVCKTLQNREKKAHSPLLCSINRRLTIYGCFNDICL